MNVAQVLRASYTKILLLRPLFLVFPKTPEGRIIKEYAKRRTINREDGPMVHKLLSSGLLDKCKDYECNRGRQIAYLLTVRSSLSGMRDLKRGLY